MIVRLFWQYSAFYMFMAMSDKICQAYNSNFHYMPLNNFKTILNSKNLKKYCSILHGVMRCSQCEAE